MTEQRYDCKIFKSREELATFMNWEIAQGWTIKEHALYFRGDTAGSIIVSVVFERARKQTPAEKHKGA